METFLYFAYGSNMLKERLTARCAGARFVCAAQAAHFQLNFFKRSTDGSGKASIARTSDTKATVYGALFEIPLGERGKLDAAEGPDYDRDDAFVVIRNDSGEATNASVYIAKSTALDKKLRPYSWYRDLILEGAKQQHLNKNYMESLANIEVWADPVPTRKTYQQALALLNKCWEESLSGKDRLVLAVARKVYTALPAMGACYRSSLFLRYYLKTRHDIDGVAKVGFVNDGTDNLFPSHAWYELDGRITDLAISRPLNVDTQRRGPLLILGHEMQGGWPWTYHAERNLEGAQIVEELLADSRTRGEVAEMEEIHRRMVETSKRDDLIRVYLDGAPDGLTYDVLADRVEI